MLFIDANNYVKRIYHGGGNPYTLIHDLLMKNLDVQIQFVCDTSSSRKPRREIHPKYKFGRDMGDDPVYFEVMENCQNIARCFDNVTALNIINAEADDYIANSVSKGDTVISNDRDLWPLVKDGVEILLNASMRVDEVAMVHKFDTKNPDHIYLYKCLVGDTSDKIPGKRGFGKAAWGKLSGYERDKVWEALRTGEAHDLINEQVLMCYKLAMPLPIGSYEIEQLENLNRTSVQYCEDKGIIL